MNAITILQMVDFKEFIVQIQPSKCKKFLISDIINCIEKMLYTCDQDFRFNNHVRAILTDFFRFFMPIEAKYKGNNIRIAMQNVSSEAIQITCMYLCKNKSLIDQVSLLFNILREFDDTIQKNNKIANIIESMMTFAYISIESYKGTL